MRKMKQVFKLSLTFILMLSLLLGNMVISSAETVKDGDEKITIEFHVKSEGKAISGATVNLEVSKFVFLGKKHHTFTGTTDADGLVTFKISSKWDRVENYIVSAKGHEDDQKSDGNDFIGRWVHNSKKYMVSLKKKSYDVTFKDYDERIISTQKVKYQDAAKAPKAPTRTGYKFTGWSTDSYKCVTKDTTVYATYSINKYTVVFNDYDGKEIKTEIVEYGKPATAPALPQKEGITITGWNKDFSYITGNTTVTAVGGTTTYKVTFLDSDETTSFYETTVNHGEDAVPPTSAPSKVGHTFTGWEDNYTDVKSAVLVKPIFKSNNYTVTFYDEDGTTVLGTSTVPYNSAAVASAIPTKDPTVQFEYVFNVWSESFEHVTEDFSVTASYTENTRKYSVTFRDLDENIIGQPQLIEYEKGAEAPALPTKEGYTVGWDVDYSSIKGDTIVTAVGTINSYKVVFVNYNDEILLESVVRYGEAAKAPATPSKPATETTTSIFAGWDTDFSKVTGDLTVKALYEEIEVTPTPTPTATPTVAPTVALTAAPTTAPTAAPTAVPTVVPATVIIPAGNVVPESDVSPSPTAAPTVDIEDEKTPEGAADDALPKTGTIPVEYMYFGGVFLVASGILVMKFKKFKKA